MSKVVVIGGGAAGMMASIIAARNGHTVTPVSYTHLTLPTTPYV